MSTEFTAPIYEGKEITFEQFMLRCARNFGALVSMRDEPLDAPIPDEFQPDDYHKKEVEKLQNELDNFVPPTREELEDKYQSAYNKAKADYDNKVKERKALRNRYTDMLEKVKNWQPPTSDHKNLKSFAIMQLWNSMDYDCSYSEFNFPDKDSWFTREFNTDHIKKSIAYHKEQYEKEVELCKERTEWVRKLKASLKGGEK